MIYTATSYLEAYFPPHARRYFRNWQSIIPDVKTKHILYCYADLGQHTTALLLVLDGYNTKIWRTKKYTVVAVLSETLIESWTLSVILHAMISTIVDRRDNSKGHAQ